MGTTRTRGRNRRYINVLLRPITRKAEIYDSASKPRIEGITAETSHKFRGFDVYTVPLRIQLDKEAGPPAITSTAMHGGYAAMYKVNEDGVFELVGKNLLRAGRSLMFRVEYTPSWVGHFSDKHLKGGNDGV